MSAIQCYSESDTETTETLNDMKTVQIVNTILRYETRVRARAQSHVSSTFAALKASVTVTELG